jgi:hypothetical protein
MSEYSIGTIADTLVALNLFATFSGPTRLPIASAFANATHLVATMARPMPRAAAAANASRTVPCESVFDPETVAALGGGAACFWHGGDARVLAARLGQPGGLANGALVRGAPPAVGYGNSHTDFWRAGVPLVADGPCRLNITWERLVALKAATASAAAAGAAEVMTGGLGQLATPPDRVVWACVAQRRTIGGCPARAGGGAAMECFVYLEGGGWWEWMGPDGPNLLGAGPPLL